MTEERYHRMGPNRDKNPAPPKDWNPLCEQQGMCEMCKDMAYTIEEQEHYENCPFRKVEAK